MKREGLRVRWWSGGVRSGRRHRDEPVPTFEHDEIRSARHQVKLGRVAAHGKADSDLVGSHRQVADYKVLTIGIVRMDRLLGVGPQFPSLSVIERSDLDQLLWKKLARTPHDPTCQDPPPFWRDHPQLWTARVEITIVTKTNLKMQVRPAGVSRISDRPEFIAGFHVLPDPGRDRSHVSIDGPKRLPLIPEIVPDGDGQPVPIVLVRDTAVEPISRPDHLTRSGGQDRCPTRRIQVHPGMDSFLAEERAPIAVRRIGPVDLSRGDRSGKVEMVVRGERPWDWIGWRPPGRGRAGDRGRKRKTGRNLLPSAGLEKPP